MTRQDAIALILSIVDAAQPPAAPAIDVAPSQSDRKQSAARKRGSASSSSPSDPAGDPPALPAAPTAAQDLADPPASSAAVAASPSFSRAPRVSAPSHMGGADENGGLVGAGGADDEALAEQRHREQELKRDALNRDLARLPMTDLGNVERFRRRFADQFKWSPALGWFYWDGKRWSRDGADSKVRIAAHETVRAIQDEAKALRDEATSIANEFDKPDLAKREKEFAKRQKKAKSAAKLKLELVHDAGDPSVAEKAKKKRKAAADAEHSMRQFFRMQILRIDAAQLAAWGRDSEMNARMTPLDKHAAPYLATKIEAFDADPWMINVNNGTLYVDQALPGKIGFKPHDPADLITKISPVDYEPRAACPTFDGFLERIQPDVDNRRFIIDWLGYSLTGDASEQQLAVFHGAGGNGKGVIVRIATYIAGDYARTTPIETFLAEASPRNASAPTPERAALPGVRMLVANEPEQNAKFDEGFIKLVTGGDKVSARDLNKSQFEFLPVFKLSISANHKPRIRDTTEGIWRRMNLVPFDVVVPRSEWDLKLDDKLKVEASGVLNVLLDGLRSWLAKGLVRSKASEAATRQYREDSDPLGRFLVDCTEPAPGEKVQSTQLYELFLAWAKANGAPEWKHTGFTNAMKERPGIVLKKISVMFFMDIRATRAIGDFVDHAGRPIGSMSAAPADGGSTRGEDEIAF